MIHKKSLTAKNEGTHPYPLICHIWANIYPPGSEPPLFKGLLDLFKGSDANISDKIVLSFQFGEECLYFPINSILHPFFLFL